MVDTNDKGTESDEDEEMLKAFSLSSKGLETPAAGVGLKHLLPTIADGSRASKALEMDEGDSTGSAAASSSSSSSSYSYSGGDKANGKAAVPVVGAVLDKLRGAVETLAKRMRDEVDASAAEQMELEVQVDNLQDQVSSFVQDLDSERRALRSFKAARSVKEDKAVAEEGSSDAPPWSAGVSGRVQKSRALGHFRQFLDKECSVKKQGGGWEERERRERQTPPWRRQIGTSAPHF